MMSLKWGEHIGVIQMKSSSLSIIATLLFIGSVQAQPDMLWSRTFGFENDDGCSSVIETADGGFFLAGWTGDNSQRDFLIVRTDSEGYWMWQRTIGAAHDTVGDDVCYAAIQTADGSFALAGWTTSVFDMFTCAWLVRVDQDGNTLWSRTYPGQHLAMNNFTSIVQTPDGGFALAGYSYGDSHGFWLLRTDTMGRVIWSKIYRGTSNVVNNQCYDMIQTSDGGFALTGQTYVGIDPSYRELFWLVKTNANGDSLWSKTFNGRGGYYNEFYSLVQTEDDGFALLGSKLLLRTNANGDSLWSRTYEGSFKFLMKTLDGGFILSGGNGDFYLLRTDENGDSLWAGSYGGEGEDICNDVIPTRDGGFALAGTTTSFYAGDSNFWLVKTGPDPLSVRPVTSQPYTLHLSPPYPNPFNGAVTLTFQTAIPGRVALELIDPTGRQVAKLFDGFSPAANVGCSGTVMV